jgi:hypothetical protein
MEPPSKESILVLRQVLTKPQIKEIMNYMRAIPPRVVLDPALHVYAHSAGVRQGWSDCLEALEQFGNEKPEPRTQRDSIET